jgi:hypothetical protein
MFFDWSSLFYNKNLDGWLNTPNPIFIPKRSMRIKNKILRKRRKHK